LIFQKQSRIWHKCNALSCYFLAHCCSSLIPLYIVNEYPKSGGTWLSQMLAEALDIPFPRNSFPVLERSILHGHMMHSWNLKNLVFVWRDGRDVLVSQYYHYLFINEKGNEALVKKCRKAHGFRDYHDIETNLIAFMEYMYEKKPSPKMSWSDFVIRWAQYKPAVHTKYEVLMQSTVEELDRILSALGFSELEFSILDGIVKKFSFASQCGREPGEENITSFMRKGVVGDWENHFSNKAKQVFNEYAGEALIQLGYETNESWAEAFSSDPSEAIYLGTNRG